MDIGEGGEEFGVEAAGALVALPAVPGTHEVVDAVLGERVDQALEITSVLGLGMGDPQAADGPVLLRRHVHAQTLPDRDVHPGMLHRHGDAPGVAFLRQSAEDGPPKLGVRVW